MMHISLVGVERFQAFEGLQCNAYPCGAKKRTIGYGHTIGGKEKEVFAPAQAETFKRDDIDAVVIRLIVLIKVPVTQNQFDALCSLVFNIGIGAFTASTLLNRINEGDATGAAAEFPKWCYASIDGKHVPLPGLIKRRQEEKALFKPGE